MNFKRIKGYRYGYKQSININPPKLILHSMNYVKPNGNDHTMDNG